MRLGAGRAARGRGVGSRSAARGQSADRTDALAEALLGGVGAARAAGPVAGIRRVAGFGARGDHRRVAHPVGAAGLPPGRGEPPFCLRHGDSAARALLALLFAYVALGLFQAILWSAAYIFGFGGAAWVEHAAVDTWIVTSTFVVPLLFMMMLDRWERSEVHGTRILEVLLDWIVSPAVLIYAAILYLYAFKILVTWSLPEGGVAYLVFGFTSVALAVKALQELLGRRIYGWFYDRLSLFALPAAVLFWIGTLRRVGEYGLTEPRVYLVVCGAVMTFCLAIFLSRRTGRYLWVVLFAMLLFAAVAYVPALEPDGSPSARSRHAPNVSPGRSTGSTLRDVSC